MRSIPGWNAASGPKLDRMDRRLHALQSEGDLNLSPNRAGWESELDEATRGWLGEDARYFLHQSLSTPCLDVLAKCEGSYIEDLAGRRFLDFHGNNVHHV